MLSLRSIGPEDARHVREIRLRAAEHLTGRYGVGHWSGVSTLRTLKKHALESSIFAVESAGTMVGTFTLSEKKIGFYRKSWFANPEDAAIYLTDMAIDPAEQRKGTGRWCMVQIESIAQSRGILEVRFDAYDAPAGAGAFYRKCGYTRVHWGSIGSTALEYYEKSLLRT